MTPLFEGWGTLYQMSPLKIGLRLHNRASTMQNFPGPLCGPGPHAVKVSHPNAPSLTVSSTTPLNRMGGTCHCSPILKGGGDTICPHAFDLLYYETQVLHCVRPIYSNVGGAKTFFSMVKATMQFLLAFNPARKRNYRPL